MAKYCQKCGTPLDEETNLCPKCDAKKIKRINKQQKKAPQKKKSIWRVIIPIGLLCVAGAALGVGLYIFQDDIQSLFSSPQYDEDNVGEIYYQDTDEDHIVEIDENISYADNEILIVANDGISYSKIEKLAKEYDASIVGYIEQTGDYQLELNDTYTLAELTDLIEQLENEDIILSASINYISLVSDDEIYYGDEWREDIESDSTTGIGWNIKAINADLAWETLDSFKDSMVNPVRVGVIDNDFDSDHEDLGFAEVFYNDGYDASNNDSHGTHVAGIMAASSSDDTGICGIYPYGEGNLYGVSTNGLNDLSENRVSSMRYRTAFAELIFRNVKVINVSQGWNYNNYEEAVNNWNETEYASKINTSNSLADFLQRTLNKGFDFVIVCSAGNDSKNASEHLESKYNSQLAYISEDGYPELYNRIIVVGAINSSFEVSNYSNGGERTDIYAPGGESNSQAEGYKIYSTIANDQYGYKTGTSMATPHVSGVAAIVWSIDNSLTGAEVKELILSNSVTYDDITVLNAMMSVFGVIDQKEDVEYSEDVQYGGIFSWVVNVEDEDDRIEKAFISATNVETGEIESIVSDEYGHFELILSPGEYTITISADGYIDYTFDSITITAGEINYLGDWIRMTPALDEDIVEYNGHYYQFFSDISFDTSTEAEDYCESLGGHLVTITSQNEQDFVFNYVHPLADDEDIYIGINNYNDASQWQVWVNGEDVTYTNWGMNEPDNLGGNQFSGVMCNGERGSERGSYYVVAGQWDDNSDNGDYMLGHFICEWDSLEDLMQ